MSARIFVCSRYGAYKRSDGTESSIANNTQRAQRLGRYVALRGHAPYVPHLYLPQLLDEHSAEERALGLTLSCAQLEVQDEVWVDTEFGISAGMLVELRHAQAVGVEINLHAFDDLDAVPQDSAPAPPPPLASAPPPTPTSAPKPEPPSARSSFRPETLYPNTLLINASLHGRESFGYNMLTDGVTLVVVDLNSDVRLCVWLPSVVADRFPRGSRPLRIVSADDNALLYSEVRVSGGFASPTSKASPTQSVTEK